MIRLRTRYKWYGLMVGGAIIAVTTVMAIITAIPVDKRLVHVNIEMIINLICCFVIATCVMYLTFAVFIGLHFRTHTGIWMFIILLAELLLIVDVVTSRKNVVIVLICLNMLLIFMFMVLLSKFYEDWKIWNEKLRVLELYFSELRLRDPTTSRRIVSYRIPLTWEAKVNKKTWRIMGNIGNDISDIDHSENGTNEESQGEDSIVTVSVSGSQIWDFDTYSS